MGPPMTFSASPMLLSITMLAAFALGVGGIWAIVKRRDVKHGVLMLIAAVVLLGNVIIWTLPVPAGG